MFDLPALTTPHMNYDLLDDCNDAKCYCRKFIMWPRQWERYPPSTLLKWQNIRYKKTNLRRLPNSTGVYAFVVRPQVANFDDCNYLLYIGKAKDQTLKTRCPQYLDEIRKPKPRVLIAQMFRLWRKYLFLYYAEVDATKVDITKAEEELLSAFMPPMNSQLPGKLEAIAKDIYRS